MSNGMNGLGAFGCERKGSVLFVHGIERGASAIVEYVIRANGDVVVLVKRPGHTGWAELGRTAYYPTQYSIWVITPIRGEWSFDCTLREQPRVARRTFDGWYRIEETLREEEPGRNRAVVHSMILEVRRSVA